jgi:orotate phosphoribosyltransferase
MSQFPHECIKQIEFAHRKKVCIASIRGLRHEIYQHGNFILKNGSNSQHYINLRALWSYPITMNLLSLTFSSQISPSLICGVPIGALPLASLISFNTGLPLIVVRHEVKDHGMARQIEIAPRNPMRNVTIIEDVITSGSSIVKTATILEEAGYTVDGVYAILDREEDKVPELSKYRWRALMTLSELLSAE